jgi:predicted peroxiredoxin
MPQPSHNDSPAPGLVIILNTGSPESPEAAVLAFRYAATAAAMDVAVEVHAISAGTVRLLGRGAAGDALLAHIRQAIEHGASLYVCPLALAEQSMRAEDLIDEVSGVRGAASLIAAGFTPGARFITF